MERLFGVVQQNIVNENHLDSKNLNQNELLFLKNYYQLSIFQLILIILFHFLQKSFQNFNIIILLIEL